MALRISVTAVAWLALQSNDLFEAGLGYWEEMILFVRTFTCCTYAHRLEVELRTPQVCLYRVRHLC